MNFYPPGPVNVPSSLTQVSTGFRKAVTRSIGTIILFIVVFVLLTVACLLLNVACFWAAIHLVMAWFSKLTLLIAFGMVWAGVLSLIFLYQFLGTFFKTREKPGIEVTAEEHPRLFEFIHQITKDAGAPSPKRIYLTTDVNAAVSYEGNLLSLVFPARKDLFIGMGLVNSLNLGEFKSAMAHEFGHFSQQSMRVGSYVYLSNKMLYSILFGNGVNRMLKNEPGGLLGIFTLIVAGLLSAMQGILKAIFKLVNGQYSKLSKEMEYHADAVAISLNGSQNLIHTLRRITFSGKVTESMNRQMGTIIRRGRQVQNMYTLQSRLLLEEAGKEGISVDNGLPVITGNNNTPAKRLVFRDLWGTHPSNQERETKANAAAINGTTDTRSPWILFDNIESLQELMTRLYYVETYPDLEQYTIATVDDFYKEMETEPAAPPVFKGYYDGRGFTRIYKETTMDNRFDSFEKVYQEAHIQRIKNRELLLEELEFIAAIREGKLDISSFKYNDEVYTADDAGKLYSSMVIEARTELKWLEDMDQHAYNFHLQQAARKGDVASVQQKYKKAVETEQSVFSAIDRVSAIITLIAAVRAYEEITADAGLVLAIKLSAMQGEVLSDLRQFMDAQQDILAAYPDFSTSANEWLEKKYTFKVGNDLAIYELEPVLNHCIDYLEMMQQVRTQRRKQYLNDIAALQ